MLQIGFHSNEKDNSQTSAASIVTPCTTAPRKSVVQVSFPGYGKPLAYYNDSFDLHVGDRVYVEGARKGILGYVVEVNYSFKIKLSEYKRVIYLVDTEVHGEFFSAGSHFISFDPSVLPAEKARTWFLAPLGEDEQYVSGSDDTAFELNNLKEMQFMPQIASRGHEYYVENHVKYLSVNGKRGYAIVQGTEPYEVEFAYSGGMISDLVCSCYCGYKCKHEFATILQLRETLELIEKHYAKNYSDYFAVILKETLFSMVIDGKENSSFTL